jgi:hypothetical protein
MTGSNAGQPVEGQLAQRLSAPRAGAETARVRAATLLRRLDSYDRTAYRSVAQLRIPLLVNQPVKLAGERHRPDLARHPRWAVCWAASWASFWP